MADKKKIALLGAGTMGIGIAQMFAQAGHEVKLIYVYDDKVRARPRETMEANLNILREEGVQDGGAIPAILDRVSWTESLEEAAAFADVVIECIVEDLAVKQDYFQKLDALCRYPQKSGRVLPGDRTCRQRRRRRPVPDFLYKQRPAETGKVHAGKTCGRTGNRQAASVGNRCLCRIFRVPAQDIAALFR